MDRRFGQSWARIFNLFCVGGSSAGRHQISSSGVQTWEISIYSNVAFIDTHQQLEQYIQEGQQTIRSEYVCER